MNRMSSPSLNSSRSQALRLARWLLLAEVALFTLIVGGAGFAIAWFAVSDEATLRLYPEGSAPQSTPLSTGVEENAQNTCVNQGLAEVVASNTTCIRIH